MNALDEKYKSEIKASVDSFGLRKHPPAVRIATSLRLTFTVANQQ